MALEIKGLPELVAKLEKLSKEMQAKTLERALIAGALVVQNDAKRNAPVRTGHLRRSIHIGGHTDLAPGFDGEDAGPGKTDGDNVTVLIGTNVEYAARQEFGFMDADSLGRHFNQPPRPYLRPAMDNNHAKISHDVGAALKKLIEAASQ